MLRKTFSQKAARVFEVVGYLLLVRAILSLIYPFLSVVASLFSLHILYLVISLIPFLIFGAGIVLLAGYIKHSRGTLSEEKIIPLWVGTFFYNALPLAGVIYQLITMADENHNVDFRHLSSPYGLFSLFLITWWTVAVSLSIGAIFSELTENQQYR